MDEAKVKEIHQAKDDDILKYTHKECREADEFVKHYAINQFHHRLSEDVGINDATLYRFAIGMVETHFGSVEVDALLIHFNCFPEWMRTKP